MGRRSMAVVYLGRESATVQVYAYMGHHLSSDNPAFELHTGLSQRCCWSVPGKFLLPTCLGLSQGTAEDTTAHLTAPPLAELVKGDNQEVSLESGHFAYRHSTHVAWASA